MNMTKASNWLPRVSLGPSLTMAGVVSVSLSAVLYSHYAQIRDRNEMKAGVERDKERLRRIKRERRQAKQQVQEAKTSTTTTTQDQSSGAR
jgi:PET assembly of cytochrome c oxidase, mitochondrial